MQQQTVNRWIFARGIWDENAEMMRFCGNVDPDGTADGQIVPAADAVPIGYARSDVYFDGGTVNTTVTLPSTQAALGYVLLGGDPSFTRFVAAGVGSTTGHAYAIVECGPDVPGNWRTLAATGNLHNLQRDRPEPVEIEVQGQAISLIVGGVLVLEHVLNRPSGAITNRFDGSRRCARYFRSYKRSNPFPNSVYSVAVLSPIRRAVRRCNQTGLR